MKSLQNSEKLSFGFKTNFLWRIILNLFGLLSHDSAFWNPNSSPVGPNLQESNIVRRRFWKWLLEFWILEYDLDKMIVTVLS